jgi:hydrogenase expression/formation protein HypE
MSDDVHFNGRVCPVPLRDHPNIILGHGGGGKLSAELVEHLFLPAFGNETLNSLGDSSVLEIGGQRLAFSTDSFVVQPLFFPGGSIGDLAVNGTVNDIAMSGAQPLYLSAGFIIEEGLSLDTLAAIVDDMAQAARSAGVTLVTGDTKVVDKGHGDGVYINTSGIGLIPADVSLSPQNARPGDVVILSGTIGDHGMAIMSVREGLSFETEIQSDSAALNGLVADLLAAVPGVHVLRDPTRGGVASALNEIAQASEAGIRIRETDIPVKPAVKSACEMLGMDPLYIANEGKLIAIVPADEADNALSVMHQHPRGADAVKIGEVVAGHPGMLVAQTALGATRVVDMQVGEQLPRIC